MNNKNFITITNKEIYDKLLEIDEKLLGIEIELRNQRAQIKLNKWIATTGLSFAFLILGFLVAHLTT